MVFRLLVTCAFVARLLTGCCAGGCPVGVGHVFGTATPHVCLGCDDPHCCEHAGCHHSHCCQPFGQESCPHHEPPAEPCGCPGHSHHFCLGTHLFAVGVERCELPDLDTQLDGLSDGVPCVAVAPATGPVEHLRDDALDKSSAQKLRAELQVYVL